MSDSPDDPEAQKRTVIEKHCGCKLISDAGEADHRREYCPEHDADSNPWDKQGCQCDCECGRGRS